MASSTDEITHAFPPFFNVYKDGRVERLMPSAPHIPPGHDSKTGVQTNDVVISSETGLTARIFMPKIEGPDQKLPLLVHYHGGGFCLGSALDALTHNFLTSLVVKAQVIAISVEYRLAPEHPLPTGYDDSWAALEWIESHSNRTGPESILYLGWPPAPHGPRMELPHHLIVASQAEEGLTRGSGSPRKHILNEHADFGRVLLTGESAGANIAHYVAVRAGMIKLSGVKIIGGMIIHPYFVGKEEDKMYKYLCPTSSGREDDPKLNPSVDPNLGSMAGDRVLVCVAGKDGLKGRGEAYYETLKNSDWSGDVELFESDGEDHCFHMFNSTSDEASDLMGRFVYFINHRA